MIRDNMHIIVAMDKKRAIGRRGTLPWSLPQDMAHFAASTMGASVIMGARTAQSLKKALVGRRNIVLSRTLATAPHRGMVLCASWEAALKVCPTDEPVWVIGGEEVYKTALEHAAHLHVTHVDTTVRNADAWFPEWDKNDWVETASTIIEKDEQHAHRCRIVHHRRIVWVRGRASIAGSPVVLDSAAN